MLGEVLCHLALVYGIAGHHVRLRGSDLPGPGRDEEVGSTVHQLSTSTGFGRGEVNGGDTAVGWRIRISSPI